MGFFRIKNNTDKGIPGWLSVTETPWLTIGIVCSHCRNHIGDIAVYGNADWLPKETNMVASVEMRDKWKVEAVCDYCLGKLKEPEDSQ